MSDDLPSVETMDAIARRLGAPDHRAFLRVCSPAGRCMFKECCALYDELQALKREMKAGRRNGLASGGH
jgi:hypothetical protein